jgi:hypothetical protein
MLMCLHRHGFLLKLIILIIQMLINFKEQTWFQAFSEMLKFQIQNSASTFLNTNLPFS